MNRLSCQIGLIVASTLFVLGFPLYTIFWVYPHFTDIITFEKEVDAKQIANHLSKMIAIDSTTTTLTKGSISQDFIMTLKEAKADFDLTKVKIFSAQGEVLYSTDAKDIGTLNTKPYFIDTVAKGKHFTKIVQHNDKTMEGEVVKKDVVETYVPLVRNQQFIGAFEIYYDMTYSEHMVRKFMAESRIIILCVSFFLLLSILLISLTTISYLKKWLQAEKKVQVLKDQIPTLYNLPLDEEDKEDSPS